jgi:hypothetical protein
MRQHTALLGLPDELRRYGLNVVTLDGWDTAQGFYRWTLENGSKSYDNPPSGVMFHGTATSVSRPVVRTRLGRWSVANAWVGLDNGNGTLTSKPVTGSINRPTIYLTAAGPARYSAGYGYRPVLDMMFDDIRPPLDAQGRDGLKAANRFTFNVENTHPNDGSLIDEGVFDHLVGLGVVLHQMFGWTERTLGHRSWTRRKPVDPWFTPGGLPALQDAIQGDTMVTHYKIGERYAEYEEVSWLLFLLEGGTVDPNRNSSQIAPVLGKTDVRLVTDNDFDLIGQHTNMTSSTLTRLKADGLYRFGKEVAALREQSYNQ